MKAFLPGKIIVAHSKPVVAVVFFLLSFLPAVVKSQLAVNATASYTCVGGSTGVITASGSGGNTPYTFNLNGGTYQSSTLFTGLAAGTYTLGIRSSIGATTTRSVTVSPYPASPDLQTAPGTNAWMAYLYDGTNFDNFLGWGNENLNFNQNFGGDYACYNVSSSTGSRTVYTETYSARYKMISTARGLYIADIGSDDGSRLTVDGTNVYNNWVDQSYSSRPRVLMNLNGSSQLVLEFYENSGSNQVTFQNFTQVLANTLSVNTSQTLCAGSPGSAISGDAYGSLPAGISLSGTGYQWTYSTTPGGSRTVITGATGATFTPSTASAPFNAAGTYYLYRNAVLTSTNNIGYNSYTASNESNPATVVVNPPASTGSQTSAGTDSWVAHLYDGTAFNTYVGYNTEEENFSRDFGDYSCYNVTSSAGASAVYTETFSVKYRMNSTKDGLYIADIGYDDGARLTVDGTMILNDWSDHSYTIRPRVLMNLTGSSSLLFEYYENGAQNIASFQNLALVLGNNLSVNTSQSLRLGTAGTAVSGDVYGALPAGISLSGTGYQWCYSSTPGGSTTNITGATGATFTPSTLSAPFNVSGTYYLYRKAILSSGNNVSPATYVATNISNAATIVVERTNIFSGTGTFSTAARWSLGLPIAGDNLIINGACTVDNSATTDNVVYGDLAMSSGTFARSLVWAAGGTNRLNVKNIFSNKSGSSINMTNGGTIVLRGTWNAANLTFTYGTGTIEVQSASVLPGSDYYNVIANAPAGAAYLKSGAYVHNDLTIAGGTLGISMNGITVGGDWNNNASATALSSDTSTVTFTGTGTIAGAYTTTFNNLRLKGNTTLAVNAVVNGYMDVYGTFDLAAYSANRPAAGGTLYLQSGSKMMIGGTANTFPINYSAHVVEGSSTVEYYGTAQNIAALNSSQNYGNIIVSSAGTKQLSANIIIRGNLTINGGELDLASFTANRSAAGGTLSIAGDAMLTIGGAGTFPANYSTHVIAAGSSVQYNGTNQTIAVLNSSQTYGNLLIAGMGTKQPAANIGIAGDLNVNAATLDLLTYTANRTTAGGSLNVANGAIVRIGGTNTLPANYSEQNIALAGTVEYYGGNQVIGTMTATWPGILIVSGTGIKTLAGNIKLGGGLILNGPIVTTGAYLIELNFGTPITRTGGHINGTLKRNISAGQTTASFEIGDAISYAPITLNFTSAPADGDIAATTTGAEYSNISSSAINATRSANRYWTLSGIGTFAYDATVNFVAGDIDAGATATNFMGGLYNGGWTYPSIGTRTATATQLTGLSGLGTLAVGEGCLAATTANAGPDQTGAATCGLTSVTLAANVPTVGSGAWSIVSGTGGTITTATAAPFPTFTGTAGNTYTLRWTITNNNCSSSSDDVVIAFNRNPTIASAGPDQTGTATCGLTTIYLSGNNPSVGTGSWSIVSGTGGTVLSPSNNNSAFTGVAGNTYTLRWTISNSTCTASTDDVVIKFNQAPAPAAISYGGSPYCTSTGTATVTRTGTTGGTYSSTTGLIINPATGDITTGTSTPGNYTVTYTLTNGVCTTATTATITIAARPAATITYPGSPFCKSSFTEQTVTRTGTAGGVFSAASGLSINTFNGTISPAQSTPGTYTVTYTMGAANGCAAQTATTTVTISPAPAATISYGATAYCSSAGIATVTQTGTPGGFYSSTAGLAINATYGVVTLGESIPGTYTVTYTVAAAGGCSVFTTAALITVTATPDASISYAGSPFCSNGETAYITLTGTTGGFYASTTGLNIDETNGAITPAGSSAGTYTVTYTVPATGSCPQYQTTTTVTVLTGNMWTGAVNEDWNNAGNWQCGIIPDISTKVTIPGNVINFPAITGDNSVKDLTILSGASLTLNGGTIRVSGAINSENGINAGTGTIEMTGAEPQLLNAGAFVNNTLHNLVAGNNVSIENQLVVTGRVSFSGSNRTLSTGNSLVLRSNAAGTASIGDLTGGGAFSGNKVLGNVTIERYIPAKRAWRLLAVPLSSNATPTINTAWQEGVTSGNPNPGYGTQISGGAVANGFDLGINSNTSIKIYNSSSNAFVRLPDVPGTNIPITDYPAYYVFVRGDRSTNLALGVNAPVSPTVLRMKGQINMNNKTVDVGGNGYTLLSNPYPSAVDFHTLTRSNVKDKFYMWDPKLAGSTGLGGYVTLVWDGEGSYDATASVSDMSRYVPSGEAFFVEAASAFGGTITFKETDKTTSGSDALFRPAHLRERQQIDLYVADTAGTTSLSDGVLVTYGENYSNAIDDLDARKIYNMVENICLAREGKHYSIERRTTISAEDSTFLNVYNLKKQTYTLRITTQAMEATGVVAMLRDKYSATIDNTPLNMGGVSSINFTVNNDPGSFAADRFYIVFKKYIVLPVKFTSVTAAASGDNIRVKWATSNEMNVKEYAVERSLNGVDFTKVSATAAVSNNGGNAQYESTDLNVPGGNLYYRIRSTDINGQILYSAVVKVIVKSNTSEVTVYPNPLTDGTIHLHLNNMASGEYRVRVLNPLGEQVMKKKFHHSGGSIMETIAFLKELAKGMYLLEITKPDNTKTNISVVNQ